MNKSRPYYCDAKAKAVESEVAEAIRRQTGWRVEGTPEGSCYDLFCSCMPQHPLHSLTALVEVKSRNIPRREHDTIHVSLRKIMLLLENAKAFNCRALFVVKFTDGLFFFEVPADISGFHTRRGGRLDRGDARDMEEMIHFPSDKFLPISSLT